jgi:hypothetical protein
MGAVEAVETTSKVTVFACVGLAAKPPVHFKYVVVPFVVSDTAAVAVAAVTARGFTSPLTVPVFPENVIRYSSTLVAVVVFVTMTPPAPMLESPSSTVVTAAAVAGTVSAPAVPDVWVEPPAVKETSHVPVAPLIVIVWTSRVSLARVVAPAWIWSTLFDVVRVVDKALSTALVTKVVHALSLYFLHVVAVSETDAQISEFEVSVM